MQCTTYFLRGFPFHASDTSLYGLIPAHTDFPDTDTSRGFDWLNSAVKRVAQPHHPPRPPVDFIGSFYASTRCSLTNRPAKPSAIYGIMTG